MLHQYLTDLTHADAEIRYTAVKGLAEHSDAAAIDGLIGALTDASSKVQYAAFSGLIKQNAPHAVRPMIAVLIAEPDSRLWALLNMNLGMRLRNGLFGLIQPGDQALADELHAALEHTGLSVLQRALFVRLLGRTGDARAVEPLITMLNVGHPFLRGAAAEALGHLKAETAVEPLRVALRSSVGDDQLRETAATALGRIGQQQAVDDLLTALTDENEFVRAAAATALGELGDDRAISPLVRMLTEDTAFVSDAAFESLKKFSTGSYKTII